ncbi:ABC transporter permease [Tuberibacillus sp. Marseille-P3662]|uniref:ABC transporter permease n=1 Tax=Tuberibacillus sp. Marseille-P3662 TaxID=1965358 RepID=UPI000A1CAE6D|nr:ABC transporter permease [Tuberibacillus sp. Marseille-P3662]
MGSVIAIWQRRRSDYWQMALRYLKLLGNSGFMFGLYILILLGGYYYQQWIATLDSSFPTPVILTVVLAFVAVRTPIRTFIQRADLVYLLPMEHRLSVYFSKARLYSFWMQSVVIVFVIVIFAPLYFQTVDDRGLSLLLVLVGSLIVKGWNVFCSWRETYLHHMNDLWRYRSMRVVVSMVFLYFWIKQSPIIFPVILVLIAVVVTLVFYRSLGTRHLLNWDQLLAEEEKQYARFLKFANMITDVPSIRTRVKPRPWLNGLVRLVPFTQKHVYTRLYVKTFARTNDYFWMFIRLTLIGSIILFFMPKNMGVLVVHLLFLYLSALQNQPLRQHPFPHALAGLYPIGEDQKHYSFRLVYMGLLIVQTLVQTLVLMFTDISIHLVLYSGVLGLVFSIGYALLATRLSRKRA